jgi:hypothetical protein
MLNWIRIYSQRNKIVHFQPEATTNIIYVCAQHSESIFESHELWHGKLKEAFVNNLDNTEIEFNYSS